ncbi:MAG: phosphoribosylamine--glycine ligase [Alphaproteobacteria bacterium]|nr:phosphoribosylamine--glycine ligase [Alphaproteobacteria bacterium]
MNVLLIGGGGREHALAWAIAASPRLKTLYCAPGNPGIAEFADCIRLDIADHVAVIDFCRLNSVGLVVVGPEVPLVAGLADDLREAGIRCFGPGRAASRLEGSKAFTKDLCAAAGIPTARSATFHQAGEALAYAAAHALPVVIKADGLAAGKGVAIADNREDAAAFIDECFSGKFGSAGASIVIEEFLEGEEASFFVLCDGKDILPLATAQDHKRVGDGDTGPNTGGMGAYSPAPVMTEDLVQRTLDTIIKPTIEELARRGTPYQGVLYAGLMITPEGPKLIEYNVRFGDPEAQVLMMRADRAAVLDTLDRAASGTLSGARLDWSNDVALTVVMAADGYPGTPVKGSQIKGLDAAVSGTEGVMIFHAGTARDAAGRLIASGGRVLNVTAPGRSVAEARARAYAAIGRIDWPEGFCRSDIGWRAIAREDTGG